MPPRWHTQPHNGTRKPPIHRLSAPTGHRRARSVVCKCQLLSGDSRARPPVPASTIALRLGNRVPRRAASVAGRFPAPHTRMLFAVTDPALETWMKLSIAKRVKRVAPDAPNGRRFALSGKPVPVLTVEDRARMEAAAKRRNDRGR